MLPLINQYHLASALPGIDFVDVVILCALTTEYQPLRRGQIVQANPLLGIAEAGVGVRVRKLVERGYMLKKGRGKSAQYCVSEQVKKVFDTLPDSQKIYANQPDSEKIYESDTQKIYANAGNEPQRPENIYTTNGAESEIYVPEKPVMRKKMREKFTQNENGAFSYKSINNNTVTNKNKSKNTKTKKPAKKQKPEWLVAVHPAILEVWSRFVELKALKPKLTGAEIAAVEPIAQMLHDKLAETVNFDDLQAKEFFTVQIRARRGDEPKQATVHLTKQANARFRAISANPTAQLVADTFAKVLSNIHLVEEFYVKTLKLNQYASNLPTIIAQLEAARNGQPAKARGQRRGTHIDRNEFEAALDKYSS